MSRKSLKTSSRKGAEVSRCAKDENVMMPPSCPTSTTISSCPPLTEIVVEKQHLAKLALHNTSCAGCVASIRALLARPLSELRMLKAVVDEHGPSGLRLKDAYVNDPKRTEQLLETFPMSSVLKKVQPVGSAQRCQLHRRLCSSAAGVAPGVGGIYRGSGDAGGFSGGGLGRGGGIAPLEQWDWEDAWDRMPIELRREVASIKASALEAAMQHATDANRFCSDCKHNVVQAHDILMGKIDLEGSENEEEFDEELFLPFEDRVYEGGVGNVKEKLLICDVADVEGLIYFHEDFSSQEFDSSNSPSSSSSGQQRHAATLEHGQREVRSILGSLVLNQLRSVWRGQTAQIQGEQYLFCLVVDAVRTMLAAPGSTPHGDALIATDAEERCAAGDRRRRRRQKRKERKRASRLQLTAATATTTTAPAVSATLTSGGGDASDHGGGGGGRRGCHSGSLNAVALPRREGENKSNAGSKPRGAGGVRGSCSGGSGGVGVGGDSGAAMVRRSSVSPRTAFSPASSSPSPSPSSSSSSLPFPCSAMAEARQTTSGSKHGTARSSSPTDSACSATGLSAKPSAVCGGSNGSESGSGSGSIVLAGRGEGGGGGCGDIFTAGSESQKAASCLGGFGTGGLAFQLGFGIDDDDDGGYDDVDPDLITEMEKLKSSLRPRSDIDFLRKNLRQNYDRFISQDGGRVH